MPSRAALPLPYPYPRGIFPVQPSLVGWGFGKTRSEAAGSPCKPSGAAVRSRLLVGGCTDPRGEPGFGDLCRCLVALRVTAVPGVIQCAMQTRLLSILVIVAVMSGCGASAEQIEAARLRIRVLASCLDEVAEGIGTGAFEPKYAECIDILGRNDGQGFRELQAADMRVAVMDLLSERETAFQTQIDRATEAQDTDARRSAMAAYQIMLGATADELRTLTQQAVEIGQKSRSSGNVNYRAKAGKVPRIRRVA